MNFDFSSEIKLENQRVLLRPLNAQDFNSLLPIATANEMLLQYFPAGPIHSPELLQKYIDDALQERSIAFRYPLVIFDKEKNTFAGSTSFANVSNKDKRLEIGWTWLGKAFQQSGLNRNGKFLMLQYAFEYLEFERVEFKADERNIQSRNAIEKIGGKLEGIFRSHTLMYDGHRRNTVYYSILKHEWQDKKNTVFNKI